MASFKHFKHFIHYHNYCQQKQHTDLATRVLVQMSQIYHPVSFSQSIATLCPPSVINSIMFSVSLRGLVCHVTSDTCTHTHLQSCLHSISHTHLRSCSNSNSHTHRQAHSHIRHCTQSTCVCMHPYPRPFSLCHTCHIIDHVRIFWRVYNLRLMLNADSHWTQDDTVTIEVCVPGPILYPLSLLCAHFDSCSQHIGDPSASLYKISNSAYGHKTTYSTAVYITQVIHSESFDISLFFFSCHNANFIIIT
jgi:hypothetical protein